jgi:hypothetical protein
VYANLHLAFIESEVEGVIEEVEEEVEELEGREILKKPLRGMTLLKDVAAKVAPSKDYRRNERKLPTRFPTPLPQLFKDLEALEEEVVREDKESEKETPAPTKFPTKFPTESPTKYPTPEPTEAAAAFVTRDSPAAAAKVVATPSIFKGYLQNKLGAAAHLISAEMDAEITFKITSDPAVIMLVPTSGAITKLAPDAIFSVMASRMTSDPTDMELVVVGLTYADETGKEELELQVQCDDARGLRNALIGAVGLKPRPSVSADDYDIDLALTTNSAVLAKEAVHFDGFVHVIPADCCQGWLQLKEEEAVRVAVDSKGMSLARIDGGDGGQKVVAASETVKLAWLEVSEVRAVKVSKDVTDMEILLVKVQRLVGDHGPNGIGDGANGNSAILLERGAEVELQFQVADARAVRGACFADTPGSLGQATADEYDVDLSKRDPEAHGDAALLLPAGASFDKFSGFARSCSGNYRQSKGEKSKGEKLSKFGWTMPSSDNCNGVLGVAQGSPVEISVDVAAGVLQVYKFGKEGADKTAKVLLLSAVSDSVREVRAVKLLRADPTDMQIAVLDVVLGPKDSLPQSFEGSSILAQGKPLTVQLQLEVGDATLFRTSVASLYGEVLDGTQYYTGLE